MAKLILLSFLLFQTMQVHSQELRSETGYVRFFSSAMVEDIAAENKKATAIFDMASGETVFLIPITGFEFRKSLMKEHFNDNYLESDKYPEAFFQGKISGYDLEIEKSEAIAEGDMTIHGVKKRVKIPGTITREKGKIRMEAVFTVVLEDYQIDIPRLMFQNIAEEVEVTVKFEFKSPEE